MKQSAFSAAGLLVLLVSCSGEAAREPSEAAKAPVAGGESAAIVSRARSVVARSGMGIAETAPVIRISPTRLNGGAGELKWGSQVSAPREMQAPVGGGDGLIILVGNSLFDVTLDGVAGHHLYVECQVQPNPRRDIRFESSVSSAGPSVGTMTFEQATGLYFAVTPLVRPDANRPMAIFAISGPSADPAANLFLRSCAVLPFKPSEQAIENNVSDAASSKKVGS